MAIAPSTPRLVTSRVITIAVRCLLLIALGSATTTAVAWGIALSRSWDRSMRELRATAHSQPRGEARDVPVYCDGTVYWPADHRFGFTTLHASDREIVHREGATVDLKPSPGWISGGSKFLVEFADKPPDSRHPPRDPATSCTERRYGWPNRAFWYLAEKVGDHVVKSRNHEGLFIFEPGGGRKARDGADHGAQPPGPELAFWLPIYILPLGFTLNTLFYAAAWSVPLFGIRIARRTLRGRRGLCTRCAYDLNGLAPGAPCPECGQAAAHSPSPDHLTT